MLVALLCFTVGVLLPFAVIPCLDKRGVVDVPNARSSHTVTTVRGGGVVVVASFTVGVALVAGILLAKHATVPQALLALTLAVLGLGAIGFVEDVKGLSIRHRLLLQTILVTATTATFVFGRDWSLLVGMGLVCAGLFYINATNFMDGVNGISSAHGVVVGAYYALIGSDLSDPVLSASSLILGASFLAFAPWNFPKARMFLGDGGSYALGASAWGLAMWSISSGAPIFVAAAPLTIYAADVLFTLVRRALKRQSLTTAHREHIYQHIAHQRSHGYSTTVVTIATFCCACAGYATWRLEGSTVTLVFTLIVISCSYCFGVRRVRKKHYPHSAALVAVSTPRVGSPERRAQS